MTCLWRPKFLITIIKEYFQKNTNLRLPISFCPDLVVRGQPQEVVENYFHLTRERDSSRFEEANIRPEMQPDLKFGRPDVPKLFSKMKDSASEMGESQVAVLTGGPTSLVNSAERLCAKFSSGGVTFDFLKEIFEFWWSVSTFSVQPNRENLFPTPKLPERLHLRPWFDL